MVSLAESERHIADSVVNFLDGAGGLSRVRKLQASGLAFDGESWRKMASLGWFGAAVPESRGGLGLRVREIVAMLESAGSRLLPEPLVQVIAASVLLTGIGDAAAALTKNLIEGAKVCVPMPLGEASECPSDNGAGALSGRSGYACDAHAADVYLIGCSVKGRLGAYAVPRRTAGVALQCEKTVDGGSVSRLSLDGVRQSEIALLSEGPEVAVALRGARDWMRLGFAALLVGLMDEAFRLSIAYLKERRQFGVPIGSFQALQHRAATLHVGISASRALLYEACEVMGTERQTLGAAAAKSNASEVALRVVKEGVQFHGAMGYSDEHDMSLFFRRAMALAAAGGNAMECRRDYHAEALVHQCD